METEIEPEAKLTDCATSVTCRLSRLKGQMLCLLLQLNCN